MNTTRRSFLAGAPAALAIGSVSAVAVPRSQADIAKEVHALSSRLSMLLGLLDEGQWEVRVSPPFKGMPLYSIDPIAWSNCEATREDLCRYYGFLWCEFAALAEDLGTEQHDAAILHEAGGHQAIKALFGHRRPSERAPAMLRVAGGRKAVA